MILDWISGQYQQKQLGKSDNILEGLQRCFKMKNISIFLLFKEMQKKKLKGISTKKVYISAFLQTYLSS